MLTLHPEMIKKNGNEDFVVLPYKEYLALCKLAEDAQDLSDLEEAREKEGHLPDIPMQEVRRRLGIE